MSILIKKEFATDLDRPVVSVRFAEPLYFADALAHEFTITVKHGSVAEPLTGATVTAYFIRADGATVVIDGAVTNGTAVVTLPSSCYLVNGGWRLAVRAVSGDVKQTILLLEGSVQNTTTDSIVDPSHVIPSLDDLLAQIAVMEAATADCIEATEECVEAKALIEGLTVGASEAETPSAVVSTVDDHYHIEFGLKIGEDGEDGAAATVAVGTVTTLPAGSRATVVNAGTESAAVLNFGIPKGADGTGAGDMAKSVYDTDDDGVVDDSDALGGHPASYFLAAPAAAGTEGQVLTADGEGGATWEEPAGGAGDMTKAVYDTNDDGKVDSADDSDALGGVAASGWTKKSAMTTATLAAASWSGSSAPYTYTLAVTGVTATSAVEILPAVDITAAALEQLQKSNIQDGGQSAGSITLKAFGNKPTADIGVRIIVRGDL